MKLTHIRIEQFRQFREAIEIDDLQDGINLFSGPNEAGKSTIVAAIRAAFFERFPFQRRGRLPALGRRLGVARRHDRLRS